MRGKILFFLAVSIVVFIAAGCQKDDGTEPQPGNVSTGRADFSKFVTIGNSITAGYQSGSLFKTAQQYTYGNLIAQQVRTGYQQPLIADPGTAGRMEFKGLSTAGDPLIFINMSAGNPENAAYPVPYNNLGIPGAALYDVLNATKSTDCFSAIKGGGTNQMFDLVLRNSSLNLGSQFGQAKALKATFITLWIGNNDVLGYATTGGTVPFTPASSFSAMYKATLDSLATLGAGIVVANIPDVTSIPFITTVGPSLLSKGYPKYVYAVGSDNNVKQMSLANNYITLKASLMLTNASGAPTGIGLSSSNPFPNDAVLDSAETAAATEAIAAFNASISSLASARGFGLVDINTFFNNLKKADSTGGTTIDGITFTTHYLLGGLFSLDGVHPSNRAHGLIANEFIKVINFKFGASIPAVGISSIPQSFQKTLKKDYFNLPVLAKDTFSRLLF